MFAERLTIPDQFPDRQANAVGAASQHLSLYRSLLGYRNLVAARHPIGIEIRFS